MATWEFFLAAPTGARLRVLNNFMAASVALATNDISVVSLTLDGVNYSLAEFERDYRIEAERGGVLQGAAPFLIRRKSLELASGQYIINLAAFHVNHLLGRRIVAYYADSSHAIASSVPSDDLIKKIVRYNLGANAQTGPHVVGVADNLRDQPAPDLSQYVAVAADSSDAPTVTRGFARRKMLELLQDIAADSYEQGVRLFFGFEQNEAGKFEFRTRINQWGSNRVGQVVVAPEFGNLVNPRIEVDWQDEVTAAFALGSGETEAREFVFEEGSNAAASIFNWVEATVDSRDNSSAARLQAEARSLLNERRALIRFSGELQETPAFRYGVDWAWADQLDVSFAGLDFAAWVNKTHFDIRQGRETIRASIDTDG